MRIAGWSCLACLVLLIPVARGADQRQRTVISFDPGWLFTQGDPAGADAPAFNDSAWKKIDVPHDWSIAGPFAENNPSGEAGAFLPDGIGWYRKHFTLPADAAGQHVFIDFDGIMANSDVSINGFNLGHRPYGFVSLEYELTTHVSFGPDKDNVIAVRCDTSKQPASRFYVGSGINRHVHLQIESPVHIDNWGITVTTPNPTAASATVHVQTAVVNQSTTAADVQVAQSILDPSGAAVVEMSSGPSVTLPANGNGDVGQDITVATPKLWSLETSDMYKLHTTVTVGGKVVDDQITPFGIRSIVFDSAKGFLLNGKSVRIQGECLHPDLSAFGTAVPLDAWRRRLTVLRSLGVNAIRASHNPFDPEFLNLCDNMGFLVMDEMYDCWLVAKNPFDYHLYFNQWSLIDLHDTVRRDRNHPSIVLYSAGNEIHDTPNAASANRILAGLVAEFHKYDPTRPVTQALFRPTTSHDYTDGLADKLDVIGTNYRMSEVLAAQKTVPGRKVLGTENHEPDIPILTANQSLCGIFIWVGADYLGEGHLWPATSSSEGDIDRVDTPKPAGYGVAATWSDKPFVFIARQAPAAGRGARAGAAAPARGTVPPLGEGNAYGTGYPDWTPADTAAHNETVTVYSNCDSVELFLNGKSLGAKARVADTDARNWARTRTWTVPFAAGSLKAVGSNNGAQVAQEELHTAGKATKVQLIADRTTLPDNFDSVSYVRAIVTDDAGNEVFGATNKITFAATGPGVVAAVDSGDNNSHEPFQGTERTLFNGESFAMIKSTAGSGEITITATTPGLTAGAATLTAAP